MTPQGKRETAERALTPQGKRETGERVSTPQGKRETGERAPGDDSALRSSHRMVSTAVWKVTGRARKMNQEHMITQASGTQDEDQVSKVEGAEVWHGVLEGTHWGRVEGGRGACPFKFEQLVQMN